MGRAAPCPRRSTNASTRRPCCYLVRVGLRLRGGVGVKLRVGHRVGLRVRLRVRFGLRVRVRVGVGLG